MTIKHLLFLAALVAVSLGCERELPQPDAPSPTVQASGLPTYSADHYATLLTSQTDEADLVAKTRLLAYTLTRYLGEHAPALDILTTGDVETYLPCDHSWLGNDGNLRLLGTATGQTDEGVEAALSAIIASRVEGLPVQGGHFEALLGGLVHQGLAYTTRNFYPSADPTTAEAILVSYGVSYREAGYVALGYRYTLPSGPLTYEELPVEDALAEGVLLLDAVEVDPVPGVERFNDPCHEGISNGGGSSSGGSGGGSNLNDDGEQKNGFTGGVVSPPGGLDLQCSGASGIRITEMHLTNSYEHFGKSEIHVNVSVYQSNDMLGTLKTNDLSAKTKTITIFGITFTYRVGKQLADAPPSAFSATSNVTITPSSGYTPNSGDWVLLDRGFCDASFNGYDRMAISVVELDGGLVPHYQIDHASIASAPYDQQQWAKQKFSTDEWSKILIQPANFSQSNSIYIAKNGPGYSVSSTQPGNSQSWIRLERF